MQICMQIHGALIFNRCRALLVHHGEVQTSNPTTFFTEEKLSLSLCSLIIFVRAAVHVHLVYLRAATLL